MTKRETKIKEKQKPLSTTASTKKSVFVDTNRFRNGCFCTNMCKACTCFKVDMITTPVGALKIIELILGVACLLFISHHGSAFHYNEPMASRAMLFLCPTSIHNGLILLLCYMCSYKTFSMVRPSLFEVLLNFSSALLYIAPSISLMNKSVDALVRDPDIIGTYILGFFLGIVHFIDATLAFVEHRKFKIQIIQGNVVNGRGGVV